MKILTLNTHSLIEHGYEKKRRYFVDEVCRMRPDVIALQEVSQTLTSPNTSEAALYTPCQDQIPLKEDNHVLCVAKMLQNCGFPYHYTWLPIKVGYEKFHEGVALLSLSRIQSTHVCCVSQSQAYTNWKTRKILGMTTQAYPDIRFYSVHYGWWQDEEEPFVYQWESTLSHLGNSPHVVLAGDFNNPAEVRGKGYDMVASSGLSDVYHMARERVGDVTVPKQEGSIDGWQDIDHPKDGMRIDQIWVKGWWNVKSCQVVFDGIRTPKVSDHFGVLTEMFLDTQERM